MPSASSCFLLSFCFRKIVRGSFSESSTNLRELFSRRNKDEARRGAAGGPQPPDANQTRPTTWPRRGPTWVTPSSPRAALSPINRLRPKNPKYPIIFSRKHLRPPSSPTLDWEGTEALLGTLPEGEIIIGGIYTTESSPHVLACKIIDKT